MASSYFDSASDDTQMILVDKTSELAYWAKEFNVPRSRIKDAVKAVGPLVKDVQAWLARN